MPDPLEKPCTAFNGHRLLRSGPLAEVATAVKRATEADAGGPILVFDDETGRVIDLDLRGTDAQVLQRLSQPAPSVPGRYRPAAATPAEATSGEAAGADATSPKGRGRPKLGVVAREVTLLPRHWEWLAVQPGGASVTLRRLVEDARRSPSPRQRRRAAQEAAYQFMLAIAGDLPGYEEATRALFADDRAGLDEQIAPWPADLRAHALRLAFGAAEPAIAETHDEGATP